MSKLDSDTLEKIQTQMEVAGRYYNIRPLEQQLTLTAIRLFLHRFGYDQVVTNIKAHGADRMATAAQNELKEMAATWRRALEVEPPPPDKEPHILKDVEIVEAAASSKDINERIYKIIARLGIREDMIQNRRANPPRMVQ
jgi:hypothetical protein